MFKDAPPIRQLTTGVSLLTSAQQLPPAVRAYEQWRTGIAFRSIQDTTVEPRAICATDDIGVRNPDPESPEFEPVYVVVDHGCEGFVDDGQYRTDTLNVLDDSAAWIVGRELWTGTETGNPSLQSTGVDIGGSGPVANVCDYLLANFEDATKGGQAYLHVPSLAIGQLLDANYIRRVGDRLLTITDHVVVPGPGYPGLPGDWGPTAAADAASGECWIYVTGPVELASGEVDINDQGDGVAYRQNLVEFIARRPYLYRFDTEFVFACLATLPALS